MPIPFTEYDEPEDLYQDALPAGPLLAAVLGYCDGHPYHGPDLPAGDLVLHTNDTGQVVALGEPPEYVAVSLELLNQADLTRLWWQDSCLVMDTYPVRLRYRPVYVGRPFSPLHGCVICRQVSPMP